MLEAARGTVRAHGREVFFEHLIVQYKMTPLPLYLETCMRREAEMVTIRLGQCIRNNAATDVFIERGYRQTQMADVARAMGVAKGTVYLYVVS